VKDTKKNGIPENCGQKLRNTGLLLLLLLLLLLWGCGCEWRKIDASRDVEAIHKDICNYGHGSTQGRLWQ
jgi:hypothetical protein